MVTRMNGIVTLSSEVLFQEVGNEAVLLDLKSERYFGLDEVGTRIWQLLQEKGRIEPLLETLLAEYEVSPERLRADLAELLGRLEEAGLIQIEPVAGDAEPAR